MADEYAITTPSYTEEDKLSRQAVNWSQSDQNLPHPGNTQGDHSNVQADPAQGNLVKTRRKVLKVNHCNKTIFLP